MIKDYDIIKSRVFNDITLFIYGPVIFRHKDNENKIFVILNDTVYDIISIDEQTDMLNKVKEYINNLINDGIINKLSTVDALINNINVNEIPYKFDNIFDYLTELNIDKQIIFKVLKKLNITERVITSINEFKNYNIVNDLIELLITNYFSNLTIHEFKIAHEILRDKINTININNGIFTKKQIKEICTYLLDNGYKEFANNDSKSLYSIFNTYNKQFKST